MFTVTEKVPIAASFVSSVLPPLLLCGVVLYVNDLPRTIKILDYQKIAICKYFQRDYFFPEFANLDILQIYVFVSRYGGVLSRSRNLNRGQPARQVKHSIP